jgi:7,8-dihydropterin-6-yl-methyl-4-(beta-D-ribofuranosyl)aminobenzene 5'-phosphate synthase
MKSINQFKISCIISNDCFIAPLKAAHGISYLITINDKNILIDVGSSAEALLHNMKVMNLKFENIDYIVLTHGHFDHGNALSGLVDKIKNIPLFCPKDAFKEIFNNYKENHKYISKDKFKTSVGIENIEIIKHKIKDIRFIDNAIEIFDGIMISKTFNSGKINEISLYVNLKNKGLVIITGCAHSGITNIIHDAKKSTGITKIHGLIGGFHLKNKSEEEIHIITDKIKNENPEFILTGHCTGFKALKILDNKFSDKLKGLYITKTFSTGQEVTIK